MLGQTQMEVYGLLRNVLNDNLSGLIATFVLLGKISVPLEWRYRREVVRYQGSDTLFIFDLLLEDSAYNRRREDGLLVRAVDDTDYVPTRCHVAAGTPVCEWIQVHASWLRDTNPFVEITRRYKRHDTVREIDNLFPALSLDKSDRTTAPCGIYD